MDEISRRAACPKPRHSFARFRNATTDDLETILTLNGFVQRQHVEALPHLFKFPSDSQHSSDAFFDLLRAPGHLVLLAEDADPACYLYAQIQNRPASWAHSEQQVLYIQHMVIAPQFGRRGVESLLLSGALDAAPCKRIGRVELDVWAFNSEARRFYGKHGFEVFNERMQLSINRAQFGGERLFLKNTYCLCRLFRVVIRPLKVLRALFGEAASQVPIFKTAVSG